MKRLAVLAMMLCLGTPGFAPAQTPAPTSAKLPKAKKYPIFIDPVLLNLSPILPPPPAQDSERTRQELAEIHRIEAARTPAQAAAAEADDRNEDMFLYSGVMGTGFNAEALPLTMMLSAHIRNDSGLVDNPLKDYFARPRPYNFDGTLHPICATNKENSYPSGHAVNGYLYAYALAEMVPEKHAEILARAEAYAHNRMVCEAHYASDLEASRRTAFLVFGYMLANPRFQAELTGARLETRKALGLNPELP